MYILGYGQLSFHESLPAFLVCSETRWNLDAGFEGGLECRREAEIVAAGWGFWAKAEFVFGCFVG